MITPVDGLASALHPLANQEVSDLLDVLSPDDLTTYELLAMLAVLRAAMERKRAQEVQPVQLTSLRGRRPQRR